MKLLAILVPTLYERHKICERLTLALQEQMRPGVAVLFNMDNREKTTGQKRNELIQQAVNEGFDAIAFHDDDDLPGPTYIQRGLEFVESGMDCAELWGQIYWSGIKGKPFHHSIEHEEWYEDNKTYFRMPNHLNFQKLSLVKDIPFPDQSFGEDGQQSYAMRDAKIFKTQYHIPEIIYHYYNGNPKHAL